MGCWKCWFLVPSVRAKIRDIQHKSPSQPLWPKRSPGDAWSPLPHPGHLCCRRFLLIAYLLYNQWNIYEVFSPARFRTAASSQEGKAGRKCSRQQFPPHLANAAQQLGHFALLCARTVQLLHAKMRLENQSERIIGCFSLFFPAADFWEKAGGRRNRHRGLGNDEFGSGVSVLINRLDLERGTKCAYPDKTVKRLRRRIPDIIWNFFNSTLTSLQPN